jgi:hypothetical protein
MKSNPVAAIAMYTADPAQSGDRVDLVVGSSQVPSNYASVSTMYDITPDIYSTKHQQNAKNQSGYSQQHHIPRYVNKSPNRKNVRQLNRVTLARRNTTNI